MSGEESMVCSTASFKIIAAFFTINSSECSIVLPIALVFKHSLLITTWREFGSALRNDNLSP